MDRMVSLLLFAALFYFMMRFGCGSHAVHGHDHAGHGAATGRTRKDPVCGIDVEQGRGYSEVFAEHEYRFCSRKCLDKFDAEPQRFASGRSSA